MKNANIIILILISFQSVSYSQNFFPMNVGNQYQIYHTWYWYFGGTGDSGFDYYNYPIVSDTLIDSTQYFKFGYKNLFGTDSYLRYDSLDQKLYRYFPQDSSAHLLVDFNTPADSVYTTYISGEPKPCSSNGLYYTTLFGEYVQAYSMSVEYEYYMIRKFFFANKFGLYYQEGYDIFAGDSEIRGGGGDEDNLISAKIDTLIYNPITLGIDSVYPVIDRPSNTFPYLMWINHHESFKGLIDSFYINLQHIRGDSILSTKQNNISLTDAKTTIYFDSLKAGDVVQFKIFLSDYSIFLNRDTYPDTGWIKINVLPAITDILSQDNELSFQLSQNYPNPFNPSTSIQYAIGSRQFVTLKVFDVLGKEVATLVNEEKSAGNYEIEFNSVETLHATSLPSGVYFYQLKVGDYIETKKMILMK